MRVLIDASILKPRQSGLGSFTRGLVFGLDNHRDVELIVATGAPEELEGLRAAQIALVPRRVSNFLFRLLWREFRLPRLARGVDADVLLVPAPELPFRRLPCPTVVVVHDVGPLVERGLYSPGKVARFVVDLRRVCSRATRIVCVSKATLAELESVVRTDPRRCVVIAPGHAQRGSQGGRVTAREGPDFLLYVGMLAPHKNVETLIEVYRSGADLPPLRLVGPIGPKERRRFNRRMAGTGLGEKVAHLGWVSADQLAQLFRDCAAVVFPSLYEGYGLPVVEALTHGALVVASDIPSVREAGGEEVRYIRDPRSVPEWSSELQRVVASRGSRVTTTPGQQTGGKPRRTWDEVATEFVSALGAARASRLEV